MAAPPAVLGSVTYTAPALQPTSSATLSARLPPAYGPFPHDAGLSVATFNERAIKVYEGVGFVYGRTYRHETNGGVYEFLDMERRA